MSLKQGLKAGVHRIGYLPGIAPVVFHRKVRRVIERLPGANALYGGGWSRPHPYDQQNGIDTSGVIPVEELDFAGDANIRADAKCYGGSQPGVLRKVLATLPNPERCSFVDLGCGKGRPLFVAAEFPFRDIVGVELSPRLAELARINARVMAQRHPGRTPVRIETGDASAYELPAGDVVLFLYNSFGPELVAKVVAAVETAIARDPARAVYVILYNPVSGALFDRSPPLRRRFAAMVPYAREERGFGPDIEDAVVIWQGGAAPPPAGRADAEILITKPGMRAELVGAGSPPPDESTAVRSRTDVATLQS
jgi:SAM-dependent methyltransferase